MPPLGPKPGGLPPLGPPPVVSVYGTRPGAQPFVAYPGGAGCAQPAAGMPGYSVQGGFGQQTGGLMTGVSGYGGPPTGVYGHGSYVGQSASCGPYQSGAAGGFQATPYNNPGSFTTTAGLYNGSQGTLKPHPNFNAQEDANALRTAMKGWGTDEDAIINILCTRTCPQRLQIVSTYKQMYGRDLITDIKSELRGRFEDVMVGLLYPMHEYLARELRRAIVGLGTDEDCLIEILCTRSNEDIRLIKQYYRNCFGKDLEHDIRGDTSGHFKRLLVSMCNGQREEGFALDPARARNDAQRLQQAGVLRWGTDESVFIQIFASQSYEQLRLVSHEYNILANHTIVEAIRHEMSGDLQKALLAIVACVYNIPFYFAEKLYKSMKGFGTSDKALIRIIVSRCEVDLVQIKEEYVKNFKLQLEASIQSDTSGDYRKALLALVHGN